MNTENAELMKIARKSLDGKWVLAVGTFLIYLIISGAIQAFAKLVEFVGVLSLIITGPFMVGLNIFALKIYRNQEARIENLFEGFRNFVNALAAYILMLVFIILWTLLLVIPGIIASISYSQTFFLLADNPKLRPMEAIDQSKAMMDGYKLKYFTLLLRIFVLALVCILTLGIGFFFLFPYAQVLMAAFYEDIKTGSIPPETIV
jgi:uncharacterized membrane protein